MPLDPDEAALAAEAFRAELIARLGTIATTALAAALHEQTVCALAAASLRPLYPSHTVTVVPARGRAFIGMLDVVLARRPTSHTLVRVIVNDELARGALTAAVGAITAAVAEARRALPF